MLFIPNILVFTLTVFKLLICCFLTGLVPDSGRNILFEEREEVCRNHLYLGNRQNFLQSDFVNNISYRSAVIRKRIALFKTTRFNSTLNFVSQHNNICTAEELIRYDGGYRIKHFYIGKSYGNTKGRVRLFRWHWYAIQQKGSLISAKF